MMTSSWIVEYYCFEYQSCKLNCVYGPAFSQICCLNLMQIQQPSPIVSQRPNQIKSATHPNKQNCRSTYFGYNACFVQFVNIEPNFFGFVFVLYLVLNGNKSNVHWL